MSAERSGENSDVADLLSVDHHRKRSADLRQAEQIDEPVRHPSERRAHLDRRCSGRFVAGTPKLDGFGCAQRLDKCVQRLLRVGGHQQRAVERIRNRLGRTRSRLVFIHHLVRRENCSETAPSNSAATNMVPSGRNSRVRSESSCHIWTILTPVARLVSFQLCREMPIYPKRDAAMMQDTAKSATKDPDRRRPSGGPVGMPVAVCLGHFGEDRRGRPTPNPVTGPLSHAKPDVTVIDINLPDVSGFELMRRIRKDDPDAKIIMFSMNDDPAFVVRAVEMGAQGYVSKGDDPRMLVKAVRKVAAGRQFHLAAIGGGGDVLGRCHQGQSGFADVARANWKSCGCWAAATRSSKSPTRSIFPTRPWPTPPRC